jgi:hypothetical protein
MSCYDWERGSVVIPAREWAGFKKSLRDAYNRQEDALFEAAGRVQGRLVEAGKGERGFNYGRALCDEWDREVARHVRLPRDVERISRSILRARSGNGPVKPRRKDFPHASGATKVLLCGEASIVFDDKARTVTYGVSENNRAVERAREEAVVRELFRLLGRMEWTRASGGVIVGNDEYNQDGERAGDGGNYIVSSYGPLGEEERRWQRGHPPTRQRHGAPGPFGGPGASARMFGGSRQGWGTPGW